MNVARVLYPVEVLGPGKRAAVWLCGCPHRCTGCSNPELWEMRPEYDIQPETLAEMIGAVVTDQGKRVDGITITGGEPFYQAGDLERLLSRLRCFTGDILVYTGYTLEELEASKDPRVKRALDQIDVLIDGRYEENKNTGVAMRGSYNQRIYVRNRKLEGVYEAYRSLPNRIQNFTALEGVISVGIHSPGFNAEVEKRAAEKGMVMQRGES